ncbi:MAG: PHB depolymerase family esterase [Clostridia bacterium]|nr:PHB depolymerase family esterase [Clostridia bacterium]
MQLKKILCVLLAFACVISLAACAADTDNTTVTTTSPFAQPEKTGVTVEGKSVFYNIDYTLYIPASYNSNKKTPLIMALHGGLQGTGAIDGPRTLFADFIGLNEYADEHGFMVIYPRQSTSNHFYGIDYWSWFSNQDRTSDEPKALYDILCEVKDEYNVDESKTYICGFSAGAAMAEIMAVTYPEVFAGCASVAGVPYKACGAVDSVVVQTNGPTKTNEELAQEIITAMGDKARASKLLVINGTADVMVNTANSAAMASSWTIAMEKIDSNVKSNGKSNEAVGNNNVSYKKTVYASLNGEEICTHYEIENMGHLWPGAKVGVSLDPFYGTDFAFDGGIDTSKVICEFFGLAD